MGLSAVVPVLHGLKLYGLDQMERQIGLTWLVTMGTLYITGAVIYAVSGSSPYPESAGADHVRSVVCLNVGILANLIYSEARTRSFTCLFC